MSELNYQEAATRDLAIHNRIKQAIRGKCYVIFSAYKRDEQGLMVDIENLDEVAIKGIVEFIAEPGWFGTGQNYRSPRIYNPTWLTVAILANKMIETTQDFHHRYLEELYVVREEGEVKFVQFGMGS